MSAKLQCLMEWVEHYGLKEDIKDVMAERGYDAAIVFARQWFDGKGEAGAIVDYLML